MGTVGTSTARLEVVCLEGVEEMVELEFGSIVGSDSLSDHELILVTTDVDPVFDAEYSNIGDVLEGNTDVSEELEADVGKGADDESLVTQSTLVDTLEEMCEVLLSALTIV